ncbi:carboxyl transferase domain-containing protein [Aestuariirhabdus litorea]|uniref:Biotin/lipoyl-binding protein n=1 Tax=Aestuariirhabdus litorea TaxID=2528527 RepID=A0A3P3VMW7_9GAMM|nr:carboxyl transferase domain-containing protein [Aestuariirhabdus litorea]RRJ83049.1 biotin/lipoyl-binding protein [Aestuariirhabdus litorea]RWW93207.1 biotin/lipoyl-binding protein [Endozoicomonadaceae bacterium GTF-13]
MPDSSCTSIPVSAPVAAAIVELHVAPGERVNAGQQLITLESMKTQFRVDAPCSGTLTELHVGVGDTIQKSTLLAHIQQVREGESMGHPPETGAVQAPIAPCRALEELQQRLSNTLDGARTEAVEKRHRQGYRSARENLAELCDAGSFIEHGQLAIAAQRQRHSLDKLRTDTAADGVITGLATINADHFGAASSQVAVVVNDYSVLAGTQGYFHHHKLDRILTLARQNRLPVVMFTEGGGGRPGDTDIHTMIAGLHLQTFALWAGLEGLVPRIAINNGYCFAGSAALFGCADLTIATRSSSIGMAGPAMIEGGGLGRFEASEVGPAEVQCTNGVIDILVDDEAEATRTAQQLLGYFQGTRPEWSAPPQESIGSLMPENRRFAYKVRDLIHTLADRDSVLELRASFGRALITAFIRLEGKPVGLIANDCGVLGGAIDSEAGEKAARFIELCDRFSIPLLSLCDTPGFMVGPDSEAQGAVRRLASLFSAGARFRPPLACIVLRKGYGLGAMAMAGGSFHRPIYTAAWPQGEFGGMGLEGAVQLGFRKELAAETDPAQREALFNSLLDKLYENGKATEAAAFLEIDAVIDPAHTRQVVIRALASGASGRG